MLRIGLKRKKSGKNETKKMKSEHIGRTLQEQHAAHDEVAVCGLNSKDIYEKQLEDAVFGQEDDILKHLEDSYKNKSSDVGKIDQEDSDELATEDTSDDVPKPAWEDDDDASFKPNEASKLNEDAESNSKVLRVEKRNKLVKKRFTQVMGEQPPWAKLKHEREPRNVMNSDDDEGSDEEMLKRTGDYLCKSEKLMKGSLYYKKCSDLNKGCRDVSIIKHVEFHPTAQVAAIAGVSGNVSLFHVDGRLNPKIQTIHFDNFPIERAHFSTDGEEVIVGSRCYSYFYYYDMIKGKINRVSFSKGMEQHSLKNFEMSPDGKFMAVYGRFGNVHILTAKTKEWITSVKMNGEVSAVRFNPTGSHMYSHGSDGEVYIWDARNWGHCYHKFIDDGSIYGTSLCLAPNQQYLACGSRSGVVNIYGTDRLMATTCPKPEKILLNMTTEVDSLVFNSTSELLVMASSRKDNAVKFVHIPSFTVFPNFPRLKDNFRKPQKVDISLNSGYLTIANNTGRALLYRLKHFKNY